MKNIFTLFLLLLSISCCFARANAKHIDRHSPSNPLFVHIFYVGQDYEHDVCSEGLGWIHPNVSGGTPPYTFLWSNNATTQNIDNLTPDTYTITVYDAVGDSFTTSHVILNGPVEFTFVAPPALPCNSQCNGSVVYDPNVCNGCYFRGTGPYTYTSNFGSITSDWNAISNSFAPGGATLTNLCGGDTIIVTITDAMGCTGQEIFSLPATPVQNPVFYITPACNSLSNGSVTVDSINTYLNLKMDVITPADSLLWVDCLSGSGYSSAPFTVSNLASGLYYLAIVYENTDWSCVASAWGCPEFYPINIPSLVCNSTVEGDVYLDLNTDCINNAGDVAIPNTLIQFTPGPWYAYTDSSGHYTANLPAGNYNMAQVLPTSLTQLCPANPFPISLSPNATDTVNFADTSNIPASPVIPLDATVYLSHGAAHPGFNFSYGVSVHNLGTLPSGILTVTLNYDPLLSFVSASPAPFSTSSGQVVWQLNSISDFQSTGAWVSLSVPPNPSLIGDTLIASADVQTTNPDINLTNNTTSNWHIITGSFDPNIKTVESPIASFIPATDGLFNYTIQFQNTGNDTAFNIEVIDTLDSDLDVITFVPGASSHPYSIDLTGQGVIHFYFNNILLPDSTTDEPRSHGFVSFQINSNANLAHGTAINNTSNIVFDFNPPVNTNTTTNTVDLTLAVQASATTICAGQQVTLTMIPELQNTPWRWRAGGCSASIIGSGNSITVSPLVTTTYFVRDSAGTIPTGACYRKTIIVNPLPNASITPSGPTSFCQGSSVTLSSNAASSYAWSNSSSTQSINVTSSGNYVVTVTDANSCTASSSAVTITVHPLPNASITPSGPTTFCQGNSVSLSSSSASSYAWSNSSSTQSINVTSSGNYVVTVTDANNCTASSSAISVTVNPLPNAAIIPSGPTTFCQGNSVTLTSSLASSYLWSDNSTAQSINVTSSGNYVVTVTDANNCSSASPATTVTVNPNPSAPSITLVFDSLVSDLANGYQWFFNSVLIPGATSQGYHPTQNGNYSVMITDANNCTASSVDYPFILTEVTNLVNTGEIFIYPNPAYDELIVRSPEFGNKTEIIIYNLLGENLLSQKIKVNSQKQVINISGLIHGIYFLELKNDKAILRVKFMKI